MSKKKRALLLLLGLAIITCSLFVLGYALIPLPDSSILGTVPATLLTPP
jgi:hypothetical protein